MNTKTLRITAVLTVLLCMSGCTVTKAFQDTPAPTFPSAGKEVITGTKKTAEEIRKEVEKTAADTAKQQEELQPHLGNIKAEENENFQCGQSRADGEQKKYSFPAGRSVAERILCLLGLAAVHKNSGRRGCSPSRIPFMTALDGADAAGAVCMAGASLRLALSAGSLRVFLDQNICRSAEPTCATCSLVIFPEKGIARPRLPRSSVTGNLPGS